MSGLLYTKEFVAEAQETLKNFLFENERFAQYTIEFPDGLSDPPVLDVCRVFSEGDTFDNKVLLTRYCILHKPVKVKLDGKDVDGGFTMNSMADVFDNFMTLKNHPLAFNLLIEVCIGYITKKSVPSVLSTKPQGATQV